MRKKVITLLVIIIALLLGEIARERVAYVLQQKKLEAAYWQIDKDMRTENGLSRKDVEKVLGLPENVASQPDGTELWSWTLRNRQGWLWSRLGLARDKGHYELDVSFNPEANRVQDVYSGVN